MGINQPIDYVDRVGEFQSRQEWREEANKLLDRVRKASCGKDGLLGLKVLDYGCGPGEFSRILSRQGAKVTGVDSSVHMVTKASLAENGISPSKQVQYYVVEKYMPYALDDYDLIFCLHVLGHVESPVDTLIHLRWRLANNGRIIILNPNKSHTLLRKPYNWLRGFKSDPTIKHRFTLDDLEEIARRSGLAVEWAYYTGTKFLGSQSLMAVSLIKG